MAALEYVKPGVPLKIPASTYNAMIDAARGFQGRSFSGPAGFASRYDAIVRVVNNTQGDFERYGIVGLGEVAISHDDNEASFFSRPTFKAEVPVVTSELKYGRHVGKVAIAQDMIAPGQVGFAKIAGLSPAQVNIVNEHDDIAIVQNENSASLKSWTSGQSGASILWHKPSTTGVQWCLCLLGNHRSKFASMYRVKLDGALATTDASITVDNLVPLDGLEHIDVGSLTAHNVFAWEAADDANALVVWNNHAGLERWELIQLDCS